MNMNGYQPVSERVAEFYERFPEGSLQSWRDPYIVEVGGKPFVVYAAAAYRTPEDTRPGIGWAWEPVPGPTSFTKDSELQNAETSAWGRAIAALGFEVRASQEEVRNRQAPPPSQPSQPPPQPEPSEPETTTVNYARQWEQLRGLMAHEKPFISAREVGEVIGGPFTQAVFEDYLDAHPGRSAETVIATVKLNRQKQPA